MNPVAVYIHIPFCPSKCGYCDFNSYAMSGEIIPRTVEAIAKEIRQGRHRGMPAKTIFFGGGTPTFLSGAEITMLLTEVMAAHPPIPNCEITSEANPGTVDADKFSEMRVAGFNRLSLGAQSFFESDLVRLGRVHTAGEIERAVIAAREARFENLNVDLMFALPGQSMAAWRSNLDRAMSLGTDHLSLYCLTIEPNTAFYKQHLRGELIAVDDELQVRMYDEAVAAAEAAGLRQYEISNFAKPGMECRHNLCYWRGEEHVAYGPGAVEQVGGERWTHMKHPERYCEAIEAGGELACEKESLDERMRRDERIMLGLRLNDGMPVQELDAGDKALEHVIAKGWLEYADGRLRLTRTGRHYCNEVIVALM